MKKATREERGLARKAPFFKTSELGCQYPKQQRKLGVVHGRRPAENALVLGASKDLVLERFAAQKGWCVHGVSHLVFFAGAFLTGAFAGADLAAIFVP